jgi:hypothetical protein
MYTNKAAIYPEGRDSDMKGAGMFVGNFEK